MFERFVRMAEARRALAAGRYEEVLQLAEDPLVREHRKARDLRDRALAGLLDRARRRLRSGKALEAARADIARVLRERPEDEEALALQTACEEAVRGGQEARSAAEGELAAARRAIEAGDPELARRHLDVVERLDPTAAALPSVRRLVAARVEAARQLRARAESAWAEGDLDSACEHLAQARALDVGVEPPGGALARTLARALADRILAGGHLDPRAEEAELRRALRQLPELGELERVKSRLRHRVQEAVQKIGSLLERGEVERALELVRDTGREAVSAVVSPTYLAALDRLAAGWSARRAADPLRAAAELGRAAEVLGVETVTRWARRSREEARELQQALADARRLAREAGLGPARDRLLEIVGRWPGAEVVRREMEAVERGLEEKEERLARARELVRAGRLAEAKALALTIVGPGEEGERAAALVQQVERRMELVRRGLDQVRRDVHAEPSATVEGLRRAVARLDELGKVQADEPDLEELREALAAEIEGLEALDRAGRALAAERPDDLTEALERIEAQRSRLLSEGRLDARLLELADGLEERVEQALARGRTHLARELTEALDRIPGRGLRARGLREEAVEREQAAARTAAAGMAAVRAGCVDEALAALDRARAASVDAAAVGTLETALEEARARDLDLARVEELARQRDFDGARRELEALGPTPAMLRTRVYDMKRRLARAQGLEGGFVLRVDEGGEFLVLRKESVTIGNLRDGRADLPILARIAGRHARIQRTMSFHGGMEDRILAEGGVVCVAGRQVREHVLKHGDRVRLGSSLELRYALPSRRSLTACLTLDGRFQAEGTDRVLLMKDRGRDGRILIGKGPDVHVRVPSATCVVEIFAGRDGRVRVSCREGGEMDGKPFRGEHPLTPGAVVRCGEVSFVLMPRR